VVFLWVHVSSVADPTTRAIERRSLGWPTAIVIICLVCATFVLAAGRVRRPQLRRTLCGTATGVLFLGNAAFLVAAGVGLNTWTKGFYPESSAMTALQAKVGNEIVGVYDRRTMVQSLSSLGFYPELNVAYNLDEFAGHDPVLPQVYFTALAPGQGKGGLGLFVPSIDSVAEANELGISWLLVPAGWRGPAGTSYVETLAGQQLYHVPGSARFSLQPASAGVVTSTAQPVAGTYSLEVHDAVSGTLVARITQVPGWHASIDGRPAALHSFDGVMQSLQVPAGTHKVRLWYEPGSLRDGAVIALLAVLALMLAGGFSLRRGRRRRPEPLDDGLSIGPELEARSGR
jgi:hypothetical protein